MSTWTEDKFAEMSAEYVSRMEELDEADRPSNSIEVVKEIAEKNGFTTNSFRMKLTQAGLYIKKDATAKATKGEGKAATGGARTSKATAHAELLAAFSDGGVTEADIDMAIVDKLTGKAALHLADLVRRVTK